CTTAHRLRLIQHDARLQLDCHLLALGGSHHMRPQASTPGRAHHDAVDGGRIINIGSINSDYVPYGGGSLYALTKAAVAGLTKGLARDVGARGITVNNVQPGPTDTDMNPAAGEFAARARQYIALQRYAQSAEIDDFVAYLASPGASFITGASLAIDGGYAA
ncbi:MAG TPA: SDR family oxidoreductase, partial [Burkholderiaceae bacterium]|nr:SDR family oxidoreductase [Burkholderiaceae bacterium]